MPTTDPRRGAVSTATRGVLVTAGAWCGRAPPPRRRAATGVSGARARRPGSRYSSISLRCLRLNVSRWWRLSGLKPMRSILSRNHGGIGPRL